jgi:hypothetical protein
MEALQSSNSSEAPPPYQSEIKRNKKVGRDGFTILWDGVGSDGKGVPLVELAIIAAITFGSGLLIIVGIV